MPARRRYRTRFGARSRRATLVAVLATVLLAQPAPVVGEEPAEAPPPVHLQVPSVDASVAPHPGMLPIGRGRQQDGYLDPNGLAVPLPSPDLFGQLLPAGVIPTVPDVLPRLDVGGLVDGLTGALPRLDTAGLTDEVDALIDRLTREATALVGSLEGTARAVALAAAQAATAQSRASAEDPTPEDVLESLTFNVTSTASGVTQTFTLPLCTPTPINITSTVPVPPTTIVSLCPVPLGVTGSPVVPPAGQPLQLYLSVNRIAGTAAVPAMILAGYTVKDPTTNASFTVRFGMRSTSQAYPESAIVGAATDYNPVQPPAHEA